MMAQILASNSNPSLPSTVPQKNAKNPSLPVTKLCFLPTCTRRTLMNGLIGVGLGTAVCCESVNAAARRPPPPPPTEKKDPNVSGVQAKVLASIRRKEAMKEAMAKLREKGKPVNNGQTKE